MSVIAATKFLERVEREDSLRTQLYISSPKTVHQLLEFAHGKGFVVSQEELQTALDTYKPKLGTGSVEPLKALMSQTS